jgi:ABC-type branched-subunit amino acid transport system substrate-binding protein
MILSGRRPLRRAVAEGRADVVDEINAKGGVLGRKFELIGRTRQCFEAVR